jgi:hypothetical protein
MDIESKAAADETLIDFNGSDDPYNPLNWPMKKKISITLLYSFCTVGTMFNSSVSVAYLLLLTTFALEH